MKFELLNYNDSCTVFTKLEFFSFDRAAVIGRLHRALLLSRAKETSGAKIGNLRHRLRADATWGFKAIHFRRKRCTSSGKYGTKQNIKRKL